MNLTKLLFVISFMGLSTAAHAQSCLQQASNSELLSELSSRLSSGTSQQGAILTAICSSSTLKVRTYNPITDDKNEIAIYISNGCDAYVDSLKQVANVAISRNLLISVCSSSTLKKYLVELDGNMKEISSDYISNGCDTTALEANKKLRP